MSWNGLDFRQTSEEVTAWIQANINLNDLTEQTPHRIWPGPGMVGAAFTLHKPGKPKLRIGQFWYPVGAARWSEYHAIIDQDTYDAILATTTGGAQPGQFLLDDGTNGLETVMYCLPPRNLAHVTSPQNEVLPGFYLASLVDERYYWQYSNSGTLTATTWTDLINELADHLNINGVEIDDINSDYGDPEETCDIYTPFENAAILMDAVCWNVGLNFVRNYDATYHLMNADTTELMESDNLTAMPAVLAGGLIL